MASAESRIISTSPIASSVEKCSGKKSKAREDLRHGSMRYLQLALGYELSPTLLLVAGLPGTGKTFLAGHAARPLRAALFHSDERRKRLAGMPTKDSARADWGRGL